MRYLFWQENFSDFCFKSLSHKQKLLVFRLTATLILITVGGSGEKWENFRLKKWNSSQKQKESYVSGCYTYQFG
jgi:hypothetical protein